jgi:sugar/nucleoside kinase (ribokinase family)
MTPHSALETPHSRIVIGGTIAIDHVKTPEAEAQNLLGGSAAYAALAASFFSQPVDLIGIIGCDFPQEHLDMLEGRGVTLHGVERSENESFTWSGEYHANMNERTTHRVGLNVLESWQVKVPAAAAASPIVVLANMSPDNQLEMLAQCGAMKKCGEGSAECGTPESSTPHSALETPHSNAPRFVVADTMDLWISIANDRLHEVLPHLDLFVLNEGEARDLAGTTNLVKAGRILLEKGPRNVVVKLGEFGAMLFSKKCGARSAERGIPESPTPHSALETPHFSTAPHSALETPHFSTAPHSALETPHFEVFRCSAYPLETVADPTGAGDTFLGGMAGYLASLGHPPYDSAALRQAIIHGSILASFTCEAFSTRRMESLLPGELEARIQHFRTATHW